MDAAIDAKARIQKMAVAGAACDMRLGELFNQMPKAKGNQYTKSAISLHEEKALPEQPKLEVAAKAETEAEIDTPDEFSAPKIKPPHFVIACVSCCMCWELLSFSYIFQFPLDGENLRGLEFSQNSHYQSLSLVKIMNISLTNCLLDGHQNRILIKSIKILCLKMAF